MSTMAVPPEGVRSTLNPNAPLFIPAALRQVEDFSPEWYELVKTSAWFREHWFLQQQEQETFDDADYEEDVADLLPESFDLGIGDELSSLNELDESVFHQAVVSAEDSLYFARKQDKLKLGVETDAEVLLKNLSLKSPKHSGPRNGMDSLKFHEKPVQAVSPKPSSCRIIQQPR